MCSTAARADRALSFGADAGLGSLDNAAHATLQSGIFVREGGLTLDLFGRVRLPVEGQKRVRGRDWDEVTDYLHILRTLQYVRKFSQVDVDVRLGELPGSSLGHGTLVRDYANVADPDHPHPGIAVDVAHERWRVTALVDNVVRPALAAARVELRPVAVLPRLATAVSLALDPRAPVAVSELRGRRQVDAAWNLISDDTVLGLIGVDVEHAFGRSGRAMIVPYFDFNGAVHGGPGTSGGVGVHAGARGELGLAKGRAKLTAQAEYAYSVAGYAAWYAGTFYDLERYQASLSIDDPVRAPLAHRGTKLADVAQGAGGHGAMGQLGLETARVQAKGGCSAQPGADGTRVWARAAARPIERLTLGALLVWRGLDERHGAAGVAAVGEVRWRFNDYLYALAQYTRSWALRADTRYFSVLQGFNLALGGGWSG
jgi:hypothetical protein